MSYCVNPSCTQPKNPNNVQVCQSCGTQLRLKNRYQPLGILGKGGFGATFGAADLSLPGNPICVVKQLRPATDDPQVYKMAKELFEREANTLGIVGNHPQVPKLLDYFEQNQEFYLVQEYVKGYNLHQEVKKNGPLSEAGVQQFLAELLPILQYIHTQKVIHRDIKPANLIRSQKDRKLVLIDFGAVKNQVNSMVASNTSAQTAFTAFAVGTAGFAPPEQMAMRPVYASDVYAVGVTCVYLLTAKTPKDIGCDPETGEIAWEPYVDISDALSRVLKKMLEVSVKHRYKSAQEVLDALAIAPYEEGMQQGMTTMISGFHKPGSSSSGPQSTGTASRSAFSRNLSPSDNTQISGMSRVSAMSTGVSRVRRVVSTSVERGISPAGGNGSYNIAQGKAHSRRSKTKNGESSINPQNTAIKWKEKTVLEAYKKGRRDFTNQTLNALKLTQAFLPGINCYESNLSCVNLQGAELSRADFGRANLSQANLKNANLDEAYLGYSNLSGADLRGANLHGANLIYADLRGANLCGVDLSSVRVTEAQITMAKTNWRTVMPSGKRGFW